MTSNAPSRIVPIVIAIFLTATSLAVASVSASGTARAAVAKEPSRGTGIHHFSGPATRASHATRMSASTLHAATLLPRSGAQAAAVGATDGDDATRQTSTCDTSWRSAVSGDWFDTSNWTNGVPDTIWTGGTPTATQSACITVAGTYTITVNGQCGGAETACPGQGDVFAAATSLTLGASSGQQTVVVEGGADKFAPPPQGHCTGPGSQPGELFVTGNAIIGTQGALDLTEQTGTVDCAGSPINETANLSVATLINSGTFQSAVGDGQPSNRNTVFGNITNSGGTIAITANTLYNNGNNSASTLDNAGQINLGDGFYFGDSGGNFMANTTIINDAGGSIVSSGDANAGVLRVNGFTPGNSFEEGAGTTTPSSPHPTNAAVLITNAPLEYTGAGASSIRVEGNVSLSGNLASGQNLTIAGNDDCSTQIATSVSANASFTNGGNITMTHIGACGGGGNDNVSFGVAGTLTNTGTLEVDPGTGVSGHFLGGNITNAGGTIDINTNAFYNNGNSQSNALTLRNKGRINLADGAVLDVPEDNGTTVVNDTGGSIVNTGNDNAGFIEIDNNDTFSQGAGTTTPSGANPPQPAVALHSATLDYTGSGASTIDLRLGHDTLEGSLAVHQDVILEQVDDCGSGPPLAASTPGGFTNAGTITFRVNANCSGNGNAPLNPSLNIGSGALTNTGTISSLVPSGVASGVVNGTLTNNGTVSVSAEDALALNGSLTNYSSSTKTLKGGSYVLAGNFRANDPTLSSQGIATTAGSILLDGGAFLDSNGANALRNLDAIAAGGLFALAGGENFSTPAALANSGRLSTASGSTLTVGGGFAQSHTGNWSTGISSKTNFGQLSVTGGSTLAGTLSLVPQSPSLTVGMTISPLKSASRSGRFSNIAGAGIGGKKFMVTTYTPSAFDLTVEATQITVKPVSGAPGVSFTVKGRGFSPGENIAIHLGKKTLKRASADAKGSFSRTEKVPSIGSGSHVLSAQGQTSFVNVSTHFKVK